MDIDNRSLWLRWVVANAIGEMIGLGTTFGVGYLLFNQIGEPEGWVAVLGFGSLLVASGAIEGIVVGLAQWIAIRRTPLNITRRSWVVATFLGALVAWFFGSIPSTLMSLSTDSGNVSPQEPEHMLVIILAGGMGAIAGVILAIPQWRVLHRTVSKAWLWLPANSAAWFLGMPIIFTTVDLIEKAQGVLQSVTLFAMSLLITGAVVGAVHGAVLVRLVALRRLDRI
ncbi:MAG: hypothetical protein PVG32_15115 [Anaerolineales bacterium]|jgi:hypothetical protein